jgi:hypothetical protein
MDNRIEEYDNITGPMSDDERGRRHYQRLGKFLTGIGARNEAFADAEYLWAHLEQAERERDSLIVSTSRLLDAEEQRAPNIDALRSLCEKQTQDIVELQERIKECELTDEPLSPITDCPKGQLQRLCNAQMEMSDKARDLIRDICAFMSEQFGDHEGCDGECPPCALLKRIDAFLSAPPLPDVGEMTDEEIESAFNAHPFLWELHAALQAYRAMRSFIGHGANYATRFFDEADRRIAREILSKVRPQPAPEPEKGER